MLETSVMLVDAAEVEPISSMQVQLITPRVSTVPVPEKTLGLTVANFLIYRFPFLQCLTFLRLSWQIIYDDRL